VHLLLSSFSVVDKKGVLFNVMVYLQGGENAKINTICKGFSPLTDVNYGNLKLFSQRNSPPPDKVVSYVVGETVISSNSVFVIQTMGGARYLQAVDPCVNHRNGHSLQLMQQMYLDKVNTADGFIPLQADQVVSSNSTYIVNDSKITAGAVLHVDPRPHDFFNAENMARPTDKVSTFVSHATLINKNKYPTMEIIYQAPVLKVANPPFGTDYRAIVYQERTLQSYTQALAPRVDAMNEKIMNKRIEDILSTKFMIESTPTQRV
jgi:hypothetical protein